MDGAPKIFNRSLDVTTPLSRKLCCPLAGTSYGQPVHQKQSLIYTHYEDMKGDKKCKNWSGLGGKGSPKVIGNIAI